MNNINTSQNNEILSFISDSNTREFYENVIVGQQVYRVLLYFYLFSDICQEINIYRNLENMLSHESLLQTYVDIHYGNSIWSSNNNGINPKIRISYALLGMSYKKDGFDKSYSDFKNAVSNKILKFINFPVDNFDLLLKKSIMDYFGYNLSYKVWTENKFSDNDIIYCAKAIVNKKEYIDFGRSKKSAIKKLSQKIFFDIFTSKQIHQIAKSSNISYISPRPFKTNSSDYVEKDPEIKAFSNQYNIELVDYYSNREDVDAQFSIDNEQLAFPVRPEMGEIDNFIVYPEPDVIVLEKLRKNKTRTELWDNLPAELGYNR